MNTNNYIPDIYSPPPKEERLRAIHQGEVAKQWNGEDDMYCSVIDGIKRTIGKPFFYAHCDYWHVKKLIAKGNNPKSLTEDIVGIKDGWRLLTTAEIENIKRTSFLQYNENLEMYEIYEINYWLTNNKNRRFCGNGLNETYRTKLPIDYFLQTSKIAKGHNPNNLTEKDVDDTNEGYRLLSKEEILCRHNTIKLTYDIELYHNSNWLKNSYGNDITFTYRTKRPENYFLSKIAKGQNILNLTENEVGVKDGWRLLTTTETKVRAQIPCTDDKTNIEIWNGDSWTPNAHGNAPGVVYRTKMPENYFLLNTAEIENIGRTPSIIVPLELKDLPLDKPIWIRQKNTNTPTYLIITTCREGIAAAGSTWIIWETLMKSYEISFDGCKTWQAASKEVEQT